MGEEDFKPGDRVRVEGYDLPDSLATKVDGEEGTVTLDPDGPSAYLTVKLDSETLTELVKVWLFTPGELVKI